MNFKFGDVLENGWSSKENPYHQCIFLRKSNRCIYVMDFDGKLSEFYNDKDNRLVKVGSVIDKNEMDNYKKDFKLKVKKHKNRMTK